MESVKILNNTATIHLHDMPNHFVNDSLINNKAKYVHSFYSSPGSKQEKDEDMTSV